MNSIGINYKKMEKEREMDELILVNAEDEEIGYGERPMCMRRVCCIGRFLFLS